MATVPEIDDPTKPQAMEDNADLAAQTTTSNISAAPATTGPSLATPGAAPVAQKSSGTFQDFSKFKAANAGKLQALSQLATDTGSKGLKDAGSAFNNAGAAFQTGVKGKQVDFNNGVKNNDGSYNVDEYGKRLAAAGTKVDTAEDQGKLAGTDQFTALRNAENEVTGMNTVAGTAAVLGKTNNMGSGAAATQDALLLQSIGDYRAKANQLGQGAKGLADKSLATAQGQIAATGEAVNKANSAGRTKALDSLKSERGAVDADLERRAAILEDQRQGSVRQQTKTQKSAVIENANNLVRAKVAEANNIPKPTIRMVQKKFPGTNQIVMVADPNQNLAQETQAWEQKRTEATRLANLNPDQLFAEFGGSKALEQAVSTGSGITSNNVYRDDKNAQNQISALEQLLNGAGVASSNNYDAGVLDPLGPNTTALEKLIQNLKDQTGRVPVIKAPSAPPAPVTSNTGSVKSSTPTKYRTNQR